MSILVFERDRRQIVVAGNICKSKPFVDRMPEMFVLPEFVSLP